MGRGFWSVRKLYYQRVPGREMTQVASRQIPGGRERTRVNRATLFGVGLAPDRPARIATESQSVGSNGEFRSDRLDLFVTNISVFVNGSHEHLI